MKLVYEGIPKQRHKASSAKWYATHRESALAVSARWREENPDKARESTKRWREKNPGRMNRLHKQWRDANPDKIRTWRAGQRATKRAAKSVIPLTAEEQAKVIGIYAEARALTEMIGTPYHVDHVIPLSKGGLHHPSNLQVLRAVDNLRKGAKL